MTDFKKLPTSGPFRLENATVPSCLLGQEGGLAPYAVTVDGAVLSDRTDVPHIDMGGAMVLPCFIDMHTHLDKGHIWPRNPNPDGSFMGALETVGADREANWSADDVRTRMDFALRCAYAHGTRAIRTHIDSIAPQDAISWPVFAELRAQWAGRIDLQASSLAGIDRADMQGDYARTADIVAEHGGVLGLVTYPVEGLRDRLRGLFRLAIDRGLELDFHADETGDPSVGTLRTIAETVLEMGFERPVTVGHCCSLAVQPEGEAFETLDLVAKAGLNIVSLPMCNMYLQDRTPARTPRWRGITLVHEMKARGINVSFASDNTRDPFYAYGDLDMMEVLREATRIAHLDHSDPDWINAFLANPARACGFDAPSLAPGAPADLVITRARNWTELFARPQSDRIVLRAGRAIDRTLPDYAELDHLMRTP
ncbi:cytosine deaminase [Roseinatronobacter monicus]|uniref:Cytosine deaminase n=1 Tax=Roseinatronobacter monicus TaxID=393481 RepID=A0A543KBW3_9RHOB|nr:cytosine deaminase [Roseinatronobacter monicus]TQM92547.1 cytosine deaminase [Roseinatronobacter monicus]